MGSQPGGGHETPVVDWIAVWIMLIGTIAIGVAMPLTSWWIGIGGGIVFLVGAAIALTYGLMDHTEDYEMQSKPVDDGPAAAADHPTGQRIISA